MISAEQAKRVGPLATPAQQATHKHTAHTHVPAGSNFLSVMSKTNSSVFDLSKKWGNARQMESCKERENKNKNDCQIAAKALLQHLVLFGIFTL